jgi:hypothetical protein
MVGAAVPRKTPRFDDIVRLCGLSSIIGPGLVRRALRDVGASEANATPEDYRKALPQLGARLATYRGPDAAAEAIRQIDDYLSRVA